MISLKEYLENPCKKASIPYWKKKNIKIPSNMKIKQMMLSDAELPILTVMSGKVYWNGYRSCPNTEARESEN